MKIYPYMICNERYLMEYRREKMKRTAIRINA